MNKPTLHFFALAVGLVCAGVLLWLSLQNRSGAARPAAESAAATSRAPAESAAVTGPRRSLNTESDVLLAAFGRALSRRDVREREALLTFKSDEAMRRFLARAAEGGLTVLAQVPGLRAVRVRFDRFRALQDEILQNADDYAAISANNLFHIPGRPATEERAAVQHVPFRNETLGFLGAANDRSQWGRGVTIAILDSGVAPDATFGTGRLRALDIGLGLAPDSGSAAGHGTAVAALAAGASPDAAGVAPAANLLSIRVTDASGTSDLFTLSQAIVAAVDAGATIVNVSLGGYATGPLLDAALAYATDRGALVVAAAGNDQAAQLAWPAADPRVVSVGAVDKAGQQVTFSNSGADLQLTAPGYGVQTAWLEGGRAYMDGTSASAPLVAGAIAAVVSQSPGLTPQHAADLLIQSASDGGAPGPDPAFGNGILNLGWAMNRNNPAYVDTTVSSHYYDAANGQMLFVVQNHSGRMVSGLSLTIDTGGATTAQPVPSLAPGETFIARTPVNDATLKTSGSLSFSTQLVNPPGLEDRVPDNNQRSSVLTPAE